MLLSEIAAALMPGESTSASDITRAIFLTERPRHRLPAAGETGGTGDNTRVLLSANHRHQFIARTPEISKGLPW